MKAQLKTWHVLFITSIVYIGICAGILSFMNREVCLGSNFAPYIVYRKTVNEDTTIFYYSLSGTKLGSAYYGESFPLTSTRQEKKNVTKENTIQYARYCLSYIW